MQVDEVEKWARGLIQPRLGRRQGGHYGAEKRGHMQRETEGWWPWKVDEMVEIEEWLTCLVLVRRRLIGG